MKSAHRATAVYDTVIHRWLRIPYNLHVTEFRSPKKPRETIIFIHGMGDSTPIWKEVWRDLPEDVRVIGIDMLGFGDSPKPDWVTYNIAVQARAMAHTVLGLGLVQRPILVGHSMGSLVSIELAKRFPLVVKQLLLCSPPLYKSTDDQWLGREKILKEFYHLVIRHPDQLEQIAPLAMKLGITTDVFNVEGDNAKVYVAVLESSIISQSSLDDVRRLKLPITILYGTFDPVVIGSTLKQLDGEKENIIVKTFSVGHGVAGKYSGHIAQELREIVKS